MARLRSWALLALALALALSLAAHASKTPDEAAVRMSAPDWQPPDFCRSKECPEYSVVQSAGDIELRRYKPAHWVMVNITNTTWDDAYTKGYKMLEDYVKGHNEQGIKLDNTNPSLTVFYPADKGRAFQSLFTIEYFVPYDLQDKPPVPSADELDILHVPEQQVWVLSFGGFAKEDEVVQKTFDFIAKLEGEKHTLDKTWTAFAQYDLPVRLLDRHNEIWVFAKQQPHAEVVSAATTVLPEADMQEVKEQACSALCRTVKAFKRIIPGWGAKEAQEPVHKTKEF